MDRVEAEVPVRLENGVTGVTRDMSAIGIYFVVGEDVQPGDVLQVSIEFNNPGDPKGILRLLCSVEVVRVEELEGKRGVAVKITESRLERLERT